MMHIDTTHFCGFADDEKASATTSRAKSDTGVGASMQKGLGAPPRHAPGHGHFSSPPTHMQVFPSRS
jgi:hypothetical protein